MPGMNAMPLIWFFVRGFLISRWALAAENLALRQQLAVLRRSVQRPRLRPCDRVFWAWLSRWWARWKDALVIVSPATVVGWHRQGFRLWWRWKSRGRDGRPRIDAEVRRLISRMARDNPLWNRNASSRGADQHRPHPGDVDDRAGARRHLPRHRVVVGVHRALDQVVVQQADVRPRAHQPQ
jgi:hypothetical protein